MRKTAEVVISEAGRDHGKTFLITEMPAMQGERWAAKALGLMVRSGVTLDESIILGGWASLAAVGIRAALLAMDESAFPLLDEMMECVKICPPKAKDGRALVPDDIEEVATILRLRDEVINLHTGFSIAAALSTQAAALKSLMSDTGTSPTSTKQSGSS